MKHKTWFRLVLKAIGVLLIGISIAPLTQSLIWMIRSMISGENVYFWGNRPSSSGGMTFEMFLEHVFMILPYALQLAIGLYLLLGGKWLINKIIPSNKPYCPDCGYPLANASTGYCPECGVTLPQQEDDRPESAEETSEPQI